MNCIEFKSIVSNLELGWSLRVLLFCMVLKLKEKRRVITRLFCY